MNFSELQEKSSEKFQYKKRKLKSFTEREVQQEEQDQKSA